jgi:hypothetical protein
MREMNKTCDVCIHAEDRKDNSASICYLCKRNPVDHRTDWFEEKECSNDVISLIDYVENILGTRLTKHQKKYLEIIYEAYKNEHPLKVIYPVRSNTISLLGLSTIATIYFNNLDKEDA